MIYFIKETGRGADFIKVGIATDIVARLKELQTGNPRKLSIMGVIEGSYKEEAVILRLLKKWRVTGEWVRNCLEVREIIESILDKEWVWSCLDYPPKSLQPCIHSKQLSPDPYLLWLWLEEKGMFLQK